MTKNMGTADRTFRFLAALVVGYLYYTGRISGTLGIVLCVVAVVFVLTSFIGWCPLYQPLGINTGGKSGGTPAA